MWLILWPGIRLKKRGGLVWLIWKITCLELSGRSWSLRPISRRFCIHSRLISRVNIYWNKRCCISVVKVSHHKRVVNVHYWRRCGQYAESEQGDAVERIALPQTHAKPAAIPTEQQGPILWLQLEPVVQKVPIPHQPWQHHPHTLNNIVRRWENLQLLQEEPLAYSSRRVLRR